MRVTNNMIFDQKIYDINRSLERLFKIHRQLSSGKKIFRPSDNPPIFFRILKIKSKLGEIKQFIENGENLIQKLNFTDAKLNNISNLLIEIKSLAISSASSALSNEERKEIAFKINEIIKEILNEANSNFTGKYIFSGTKTLTKPFVATYEKGKIIEVKYNGDENIKYIEVGEDNKIAANLAGSYIFDVSFGVSNFFQRLISLREAIESSRILSISTLLNGISKNIDIIRASQAEIGVIEERARLAVEKLKDIEINFSDDLSNLEDTDFAEAAINLAKSEIVYKEALLLAYKMLRMNLEEFLK